MSNILISTLASYWKRPSDAIAIIGSTPNTNGMQIAASDGTNARNIKCATDGTLLTQVSGSSIPITQPVPSYKTAKTTLATLLSAGSVAAGGYTSKIDLGITNEDEIWILVSIDQQPWTLTTSHLGNTDGFSTLDAIFPKRNAVTSTYAASIPATSLYLGMRTDLTGAGLTPPTTMLEARALQVPPLAGSALYIANGSASTATITVKVYRIWR